MPEGGFSHLNIPSLGQRPRCVYQQSHACECDLGDASYSTYHSVTQYSVLSTSLAVGQHLSPHLSRLEPRNHLVGATFFCPPGAAGLVCSFAMVRCCLVIPLSSIESSSFVAGHLRQSHTENSCFNCTSMPLAERSTSLANVECEMPLDTLASSPLKTS